jgi:uncharacterized repeat protein (TIGR02543 family)
MSKKIAFILAIVFLLTPMSHICAVNTETRATVFSVTVPVSLPISIESDGTIITATDAKIINNSAGMVQVVNMEIQQTSNWAIRNFDRDLINEKVNSNQIGLMINNCKTNDDGSISFNPLFFDVLDTSEECTIDYMVKTSASSERQSNILIANIIWTIDWCNTFNINYVANGGYYDDWTTTNNITYSSMGHELAGTYKEPFRNNCVFEGWYTDTDFKNKLDISSLTKDTTVYAKWTTEYTVNHLLQELDNSSLYTIADTEKYIGVVGQKVTPPTKNYENYTTPATQTVVIDASGNFAVNYYYQRNNYWLDVNFIVDGEFTGGPADENWPSGLNTNFLSVYINDWISGTGRDYCRTSMFGSKYEIVISNLPNGWYYAGTYEEGADYWDNGTTLIRKEDKGIITENTGMRLIINSITSDMNRYEVQFNSNGGMGIMNNMEFVFDDEFSEVKWLTPNSFTRSGYTFVGWNTKPDGTGISYSNEERVQNLTTENNKTIVLYAQWN